MRVLTDNVSEISLEVGGKVQLVYFLDRCIREQKELFKRLSLNQAIGLEPFETSFTQKPVHR